MLYFIEALRLARPVRAVKIGTSNNPVARLARLQSGSPVPLCLRAVAEGGKPEERTLHLKLHHLRLHGEWFFGGDDSYEAWSVFCKLPSCTEVHQLPRMYCVIPKELSC